MNEQQISRKYKKLQEKLQSVYADIDALQESCKHNFAVKKHRASTGNYDPSCDGYWIEYKCPDCGKFWTVEQ